MDGILLTETIDVRRLKTVPICPMKAFTCVIKTTVTYPTIIMNYFIIIFLNAFDKADHWQISSEHNLCFTTNRSV